MFEHPSPAQKSGDTNIKGADEYLDPSLFEWKVTHVVPSLNINLETSVLRYALVVHVHEFTESKGRYGAAYAKGDEAQPNQV